MLSLFRSSVLVPSDVRFMKMRSLDFIIVFFHPLWVSVMLPSLYFF